MMQGYVSRQVLHSLRSYPIVQPCRWHKAVICQPVHATGKGKGSKTGHGQPRQKLFHDEAEDYDLADAIIDRIVDGNAEKLRSGTSDFHTKPLVPTAARGLEMIKLDDEDDQHMEEPYDVLPASHGPAPVSPIPGLPQGPANVYIFWDLDNKHPDFVHPHAMVEQIRSTLCNYGIVRAIYAVGNIATFKWVPPAVTEARRFHKEFIKAEKQLAATKRGKKAMQGKNYCCEYCGAHFLTLDKLQKHFKSLHEREMKKRMGHRPTAKKFLADEDKVARYHSARRATGLGLNKPGIELGQLLKEKGVEVIKVENKDQAADRMIVARASNLIHRISSGKQKAAGAAVPDNDCDIGNNAGHGYIAPTDHCPSLSSLSGSGKSGSSSNSNSNSSSGSTASTPPATTRGHFLDADATFVTGRSPPPNPASSTPYTAPQHSAQMARSTPPDMHHQAGAHILCIISDDRGFGGLLHRARSAGWFTVAVSEVRVEFPSAHVTLDWAHVQQDEYAAGASNL